MDIAIHSAWPSLCGLFRRFAVFDGFPSGLRGRVGSIVHTFEPSFKAMDSLDLTGGREFEEFLKTVWVLAPVVEELGPDVGSGDQCKKSTLFGRIEFDLEHLFFDFLPVREALHILLELGVRFVDDGLELLIGLSLGFPLFDLMNFLFHCLASLEAADGAVVLGIGLELSPGRFLLCVAGGFSLYLLSGRGRCVASLEQLLESLRPAAAREPGEAP